MADSTDAQRQHVAEVIFRFVQGSIYRNGVFNGDPHPGNYRFHDDGTVTFLDFGLVKRWAEGEFEALMPLIDPLLDREADVMVERMVKVGFLPPDHGLDPMHVWEYVSAPYKPYLEPEFTFTRDFTGTTMMSLLDVTGPFADVIAKLMMPTSFVQRWPISTNKATYTRWNRRRSAPTASMIFCSPPNRDSANITPRHSCS